MYDINLLSVDVHYYKDRRADSLKVSFYTNISSVSTCCDISAILTKSIFKRIDSIPQMH